MSENEIYKQLIDKYNNLTEEEKKAILIYKSGLYYHINEISSIDDFLNKESFTIFKKLKNQEIFLIRFSDFKNNLSNPKNIFLKYSIFNIIDFTDIYTFIDSIKEVYKIINNIRLYLPEQLTVYRGVCSDDEILDISKSNLISTTIDVEEVKPFLFGDKKNNKLYVISLEKDTPVLISPYSIDNIYDSEIDYYTNKPKQLKLVNKYEKGNQEIILFKNTLNFTLNDSKTIDEYNLTIEKLSSEIKNQDKGKSTRIH